MKWLVVCLGIVCAATPALAGGVNLAWNNCASEGGVANRASACDANTGTNTLVGSFALFTDLPGVTGIEIVIDLLAGDGTSPIPAWWQFSGAGACRIGALTMNGTVNAANTICNDWASGASAGGLAAYDQSGIHSPANDPAHRRIKAGFAVPAVSAADLVTTGEYFACNVNISNTKSVGSGACAGCTTPVCFVLQQINVVPGTNPGQRIAVGTTTNSNFATWQGAGPDCNLVPTKRSTWSQAKSHYK